MAEVMRASRTVENEIIIAPAHVTASAILHAYQLLATSGQEQTYALVAKSRHRLGRQAGRQSGSTCRSRIRCAATSPRACSPNRASKLSQFSKVTYGNTSGGGLVALGFDMADVTVADEAQAKEWIAAHPGQARILKTTRPVPGRHEHGRAQGLLRHRMRAPRRCGQLASEGADPGRRARSASPRPTRPSKFTYVALARHRDARHAQRRHAVSAEEVAELRKQGATIVDTRAPEGVRQRARSAARCSRRTSRRA